MFSEFAVKSTNDKKLQAQAIDSDIPVSSKWQFTLMMEFRENYEESFLKGKDTQKRVGFFVVVVVIIFKYISAWSRATF